MQKQREKLLIVAVITIVVAAGSTAAGSSMLVEVPTSPFLASPLSRVIKTNYESTLAPLLCPRAPARWEML